MIRINRALDARLVALRKDGDKGFTLIELLVVVIIIGILAAIAIPVYLGIQNNAKDSAAQSDLTNAKIAVIAYQTDTGALPTAGVLTTTSLPSKYGFTQGTNTTSITLTVDTGGTIFCIAAISITKVSFGATDSAGVLKGTCSAGAFTKA